VSSVESQIKSLSLEGPAGRLEALLNVGSAAATHAAVVCHPHPLFGGSLHNKVVFRVARARNIPVMVTYAGGYARDVEDTVTIHCNTVIAAQEVFSAKD